MSHFSGHFEGASTFLTPKKVLAPSKRLIKLLSHKKNYVPKFLKQRDINSYMFSTHICKCSPRYQSFVPGSPLIWAVLQMFWLELGPALCNGLGIFKPFANSIPSPFLPNSRKCGTKKVFFSYVKKEAT
jgi:hypothetical protein